MKVKGFMGTTGADGTFSRERPKPKDPPGSGAAPRSSNRSNPSARSAAQGRAIARPGEAKGRAQPDGTSEAPLAGLGERFAANFVDGLLFMFFILFSVFSVFSVGQWMVFVGALLVLGFATLCVYQAYLSFTCGQSIGKRMCSIAVVRISGERAEWWRLLFLRNLLPQVLSVFTQGIFGFVDTCFIFRENRRCLHDLMAGTKVVVRPKAK